MLLHITHKTHYKYSPPVDTAQHISHLHPLDLSTQQVLSSNLHIDPKPASMIENRDVFGNLRAFFSLQSRHDELIITSTSLILTKALELPSNTLKLSPAWETVRDHFRYHASYSWDAATEFVFPSMYAPHHVDFAEYARPSFSAQRPILEAACDLMTRIHRELKYASNTTDINTPAREALTKRQGVCQDFAHILLACLRTLGLAARYVSGYLLTVVPEGKKRLIGSDASHAWVSIYIPDSNTNGLGTQGQWYDLDPTNNRWGLSSPGEDYVTLAIGRDFADVSPVRGVIHGGTNHTLDVGVTVRPVEQLTS